jgi:pimeloyl-ACP methyl ester carboxylesterase
VRSVLAVVVGYLVFAGSAALLFQITGQAPHAPASPEFMASSILYGVVFAGLGGYVAARVARHQPARHAALVAGLIALGAVISLVMGSGSAWSQVAAILLMAPAAWVAGYWRARRAAVAQRD